MLSFKEFITEAAVDGKGHKSSTGGLTQKGRDYYNNKTGGNLQAPVTTPPSKLKAGIDILFSRSQQWLEMFPDLPTPQK